MAHELRSFFSFSGFQPLPEVPPVWKPAVQCPDCSYPNDTGFRFCQACRYKRKSLAPDDYHYYSCPSTLAAGTVANIIGKLRSLFVESGRGVEWNDLLGIGNPASHHSVKQCLVLIREEQARARITPKQAVSFSINFYAYAPF